MLKKFVIFAIAILSILTFSAQANAQWYSYIGSFSKGMSDRRKEIEAERRADRELELRARELDILERSLQQRSTIQTQDNPYPTPKSDPVVQVQSQRVLRTQWCSLPGYTYQAQPSGGVLVWDTNGNSVRYPHAQLVNGVLFVYAKC